MSKPISELVVDRIFWQRIEEYLSCIKSNIPDFIYYLIPLLVIVNVLFVIWKGWKKRLVIARFILAELIFIILFFTVIYRDERQDCKFEMMPFWSYQCMQNGKPYLLVENFLNIFLFIPVGFLVKFSFIKLTCTKIIGIGLFISSTIEIVQFISKRGFCEIDDVIHNTIGCTIGYLFASLVLISYNKFVKKEREPDVI